MSEKRLRSDRVLLILRIAVATHLAATGVCVLASRLDRGLDKLPLDRWATEWFIGVPLFGALLAWLVCPITVLTIAVRCGLSRQIAYALLAEALLSLFQAYALLPAVQ